MSMWRVSVKTIEDMNAWEMCKSQGIIAIGWPSNDNDSVPQVRRFGKIAVGDYVIAHVPESHGGSPGLVCGVGIVTSPCVKIYRPNLPNNDEWNGQFRRQCSVKWLSIDKYDLRGLINYWRGTVHLLKPDLEIKIHRLYKTTNL